MSGADASQVRLVDTGEGQGRTAATLLASLAARLTALHMISGADAVGALMAGFAALGRDAAGTAEGQRLQRGIDSGRAGANGKILWSSLAIDEWASSYPPPPILDHLRNDLALVLADDVLEILEMMPFPAEPSAAPEEARNATFAECVLGMWVFGKELVRGVEMLADPTLPPTGSVEPLEAADPEPVSRLLR